MQNSRSLKGHILDQINYFVFYLAIPRVFSHVFEMQFDRAFRYKWFWKSNYNFLLGTDDRDHLRFLFVNYDLGKICFALLCCSTSRKK